MIAVPTTTAGFDWVFDNSELERRMTRKQRLVAFKTARFALQTMRRSFRTGKAPSAPGKPPKTRGRRLLRVHTVFEVSPDGLDAVVGPKMLTNVKRLGRVPGPQLLNEGGSIRRAKVNSNDGRLVKLDRELANLTDGEIRARARRRNLDATGGRLAVTARLRAKYREQLVTSSQKTARIASRPFVEPVRSVAVKAWLENEKRFSF